MPDRFSSREEPRAWEEKEFQEGAECRRLFGAPQDCPYHEDARKPSLTGQPIFAHLCASWHAGFADQDMIYLHEIGAPTQEEVDAVLQENIYRNISATMKEAPRADRQD